MLLGPGQRSNRPLLPLVRKTLQFHLFDLPSCLLRHWAVVLSAHPRGANMGNAYPRPGIRRRAPDGFIARGHGQLAQQ